MSGTRPAVARRMRHSFNILRRAIGDFTRHEGPVYAAAVAYHVLLSLFPLVIILVAAFGLIARGSTAGSRAIDDLIAQIPPGTLREQVQSIATAPAAGSGALGLVGLFGALWTASGMFGALRRALNNAFDVPAARPFLSSRLRDLASIPAIVLLVFLSTALTAILSLARALAGRLGFEQLVTVTWTLVTIPLPLLASTLVFLLAYRLLPNHRLLVRDLWAGALLAGIGFELAKSAFAVYLARFARYDALYGR